MVHTKDQTDALANELDQQCKLDQHSSTPKKKSNKKKSKKNTVESLNPLYENFFLNIPIAIKNTKAKGRHAVATENLAPGMLASNEKAVAFVVRSDFIDEQCHVCLSTLEQKLMCGDCKKVFYCSNSCMEKDERHRFLCDALDQIDGIAQATDVDADLIRLIITLMAQKHLDKDKKSGLSNNQATSSQAFFWCVDDLVSHRDKAEPIFLAVVKEACK
ncbi:hypothetical protein BDB01DRAFT_44491 [Pilobolus umbonatus]|nr:hypothetical protein BDB01DRAFT_44491 [Pilobolus umbonatus]